MSSPPVFPPTAARRAPAAARRGDRRLLRHLTIAVLVKLAVLFLLWWGFARHDGASVDADGVAHRVGAGTTVQGVSK